MCVIACYETNYPDPKDLINMESMNQHGAGVAWIEDNTVKWRKGINAKEIINMIKSGRVKIPFIVHFRIASVGGVDKKLCHPFPINNNVELDLNGESDRVLFHNGTWTEFKNIVVNTVMAKGINIPDGKLSDTRIMAWLASIYNINFLLMLEDMEDQKLAVLTPNGIEKYGKWDLINEKSKTQSFYASNNYWEKGFQEVYFWKSQGMQDKTETEVISKRNGKSKKRRGKKQKLKEPKLELKELTHYEASTYEELVEMGFDFDTIEKSWKENDCEMNAVYNDLVFNNPRYHLEYDGGYT